MYLNSSVCISYQPTFLNEDILSQLEVVGQETALYHPDYKEYVSPAQIRRMSAVLKMGMATGVEALRQANDAAADAIIVGTGLGCIQDTLKFVGAMYESVEGTQSPTAFIQSTHNSIAGQLALLLGNHNYNMTHTQGNLSLAYALLDAQLLLAEGDAAQVLVGAIDEMTSDEKVMITALAERYDYPLPILGEGSAFFHLSAEKKSISQARISAIRMGHDGRAEAHLPLLAQADLVLTNVSGGLDGRPHVTYTNYCGEFFTASGFGLFLAVEHLKSDKNLKNILLHHRFGPQEMAVMVERP